MSRRNPFEDILVEAMRGILNLNDDTHIAETEGTSNRPIDEKQSNPIIASDNQQIDAEVSVENAETPKHSDQSTDINETSDNQQIDAEVSVENAAEAAMAMPTQTKENYLGAFNGYGSLVKDDAEHLQPVYDQTVQLPTLADIQQNQVAQQVYVAPQAPMPVQQYAQHRVDVQPAPPKQEVKKADPDRVNVDLDLVQTPEVKEKSSKQPIYDQLPEGPPIMPQESIFDNSHWISEYEYLGVIQKIAIECNAQVQFIMQPLPDGSPSGIIACFTFSGRMDQPNPLKSFYIDTGVIIDNREKVLINRSNASYYEDMDMRLIYIYKGNGKNQKKEIDKTLFKDIFTTGFDFFQESRLYSKELIEVNKIVEMITMPTGAMKNSENRKAVRNRIIEAFRKGVFRESVAKNPHIRFRFKNYDIKSNYFTLTSKDVPYRLGAPVMSNADITIEFKEQTVVNPR